MNEKSGAANESTGTRGDDENSNISSFDTLEFLKWTLDGVQEQIRFADTKAGFVVLFHTFLFGFIISQAETLATVAVDGRDCLYYFRMALFTGYAVASITSIWFAIAAVIPKFGTGAPRCRIFFGHIVAEYGRNYDGYHQAVLGRSEADWLKDLTSQIVENSNIANDKHRRAGTAARWAVATVVLAFLGIASLFVSSF